jgi:hypothetical protein
VVQAERHFVDDQDLRVGHDGSRQRKHLALPAAELACQLLQARLEDGKKPGDQLGELRAPALRRQAADECEVFLDGEVHKHLVTLGNTGKPLARHTVRLAVNHVLAGQQYPSRDNSRALAPEKPTDRPNR